VPTVVQTGQNLSDLRDCGRRLLEVLLVDDLPAFVAELEGLKTQALVRLLGHQTPQPLERDDENLTAGELAGIFNVPKSFFYEMARQGRIPVQRLGRYRRFNRAAVEAALASNDKTDALAPAKRRRNGAGFPGPATAVLPPAGSRLVASGSGSDRGNDAR